MKKFFAMAAILLLAASCSNESELTVNNAQEETAPVKVRVSDFSMSMDEMSSEGGSTRAAQDAASYDGVGAITLAFYDASGNEVVKTTQIKTDGSTYTTFGEFSANLPVGNYSMVAVARGYFDGDAFTLTSPTLAAYTSERPRETFCAKQDVTVTSASPLDLDVTLSRISAKLEIISTDNRPAGISKVRTTFAKGGKSFNPTTGLTTVDTGFSQTNSPSSANGSPIDIAMMPLLYTDEESMNVTIEVLDGSDNVLATKVVPNVPFKRNRQTTLTGAVFSAEASSATFKLETSWLASETVPF